MEGAQPGKILAGLLQAYILADDANDIRLLLHLLREGTCLSHLLLLLAPRHHDFNSAMVTAVPPRSSAS